MRISPPDEDELAAKINTGETDRSIIFYLAAVTGLNDVHFMLANRHDVRESNT